MTIKLHFKFVHVCHNHGASLGSSEEGLNQTSLETIWQPPVTKEKSVFPIWLSVGGNRL